MHTSIRVKNSRERQYFPTMSLQWTFPSLWTVIPWIGYWHVWLLDGECLSGVSLNLNKGSSCFLELKTFPSLLSTSWFKEWIQWIIHGGNADTALKPDFFDFSPNFSTKMNVSLPLEGHIVAYKCKCLDQNHIVCEYEVNLSTNEKVITEKQNINTNC